MLQAIFRIPANKSGLDPDIVVPGGGLAARSGKEGIMLRMVSREGQANDDGTEPVWLPAAVALDEAHQKGRTVTGFAGIIRNARGLGLRVRRTNIAAARLSLLKDDDRIDEETAKVLIPVEYEICGAHIDTPLLSVAAAFRSKGWKTIPTKSKPVGHNKKMLTVGAEAAPTIVKTFRMPEGFLVIGQEAVSYTHLTLPTKA